MIDIVANGKEWVDRWAKTTFDPSSFFRQDSLELDSGTLTFATGCFLLTYLVSILTCIGYFVLFYPNAIRKHLVAEKTKAAIEAISLASAGYLVAMLMAILCMAAVSFLIYARFGSTVTFDKHFAALLHLHNLEPVAGFFFTLLILVGVNFQGGIQLVHNDRLGLFSALLFGFLFLLLRVYYVVLGSRALSSLHQLSPQKNRKAFLIGFLPPMIISSAIYSLAGAFIALLMVTNWD
jgi:hypothetical protein